MHCTSTMDERKAAVQGAVIGGIDVAQDWHYIHWLFPNGLSAGKPMRFANSRSGFEALWAQRPPGTRSRVSSGGETRRLGGAVNQLRRATSSTPFY